MEIKFIKISPTQNMTILVTDKIAREYQRDIAEKLMRYDSVYAEQVGFIEKPGNREASVRLQMMGGEFCGNASLSIGAYITSLQHLPSGSVNVVKLEVSGCEELLDCHVNVLDFGYKCKVKLPPPISVNEKSFTLSGAEYMGGLVEFPGISHLIIDTAKYQIDMCTFVTAALEAKLYGEADAFGIMFYDSDREEITPFVYVADTDSKVWERGCGSGSAALGVYLSYKSAKSGEFSVSQPGGEITAYADFENGEVTSVSIESCVKIVAEGVAYI